MSVCLFALIFTLYLSVTPGHATIDPARSLFITDRAVLDGYGGGQFALQRVFDQIVSQSRVAGLTSRQLWNQWWDGLRRAPGLGLGPHCDDQGDIFRGPTFNDYPLECPRAEAVESTLDPFDPASRAFYSTIALVNRFDLAPPNGADCGEYRMVFARKVIPTSSARNFVILEAVLPNPRRDLGLEGCRPVAQFWEGLSAYDNPDLLAQRLEQFYFQGIPGFPPVVKLAHYLKGQFRANMFITLLWQLREFSVTHTCGKRGPCTSLQIVPTTTTDSPWGALFDDTFVHPQAAPFRRQFVRRALPGLLADDVMQLAFQSPKRFLPGQSTSQALEGEYPIHVLLGSGTFTNEIQRRLTRRYSPLTPVDIASRAMTQSCAGCHQLSAFGPDKDLGDGLTWPASLGFVHVDEAGNISPALRDVFLPHRQQVLEEFLSGTALRSRRIQPATPDIQVTIGGPKRAH